MNHEKESTEGELALRFSREQGFFDKSRVVQFFVALVLFFCVFFVIHFREIRVDVLELHTIAESYVVAQVDFEFLDEEATTLHRQEAVRDIGNIYRITKKNIRQHVTDFENYLKKDGDWRSIAENSTFEEIYKAVDVIESILGKMRFTDPRTLYKMREMGLPNQDYHIFTPPDVEAPAELPEQIWEWIQTEGLKEHEFLEDTVTFLLGAFHSNAWKLEVDMAARGALSKVVQKRVGDKSTHVSAGDRIIDQGVKVTSRHLAMLQAMKHTMSEQRNLWRPMTILGSFLMTGVLLSVCFAYFRVHHEDILASNRKLFLLVLIVLLTFAFGKVTEYFLLKTTTNLLDVVRYPLFAPLSAILLCSLFSPGIAIFVTGTLAVLLTMTLAVERHGFLIINLAPAVVTVLAARSLRQRKDVFAVCVKAWLCCFGLILSLHLYWNTIWSISVVTDVVSSFIFMTITAILAVGLLPLLESGFHILTDVALMEYMDPNNEILRRLSIEAPGTYQHSIVVGTLAEAGATAVGANGLFCRAATLYHDIGKLATPHYFTENQQGMNMHQLLTPLESAQVIIAHVAEGVSIGRKIGLPEQFIDVIKEHHGITPVYYFYHKQLEQLGEEAAIVQEKEFRYAGPKPHSKESAIIMIADSFEAASRSLDEVSEEILTQLIDQLVADKAEDGQFDESDLTFEELGIVKRMMVKTLVAARHSRVKYPKKKKKEEEAG